MNHFALTPGLLAHAEVAYRQERVGRDLAGRRHPTRWWDLRGRRATATHDDDLTLAA